jgi:hypothetical protein
MIFLFVSADKVGDENQKNKTKTQQNPPRTGIPKA